MKINPNLPDYMKIVDDKLIRGKAVSSPLRLHNMKKENINQIIDLRNSASLSKYVERLMCKILGIKYINHKYPHRINHLPNPNFFEQINQNIINNKGKTYIHCQYGKRRTGVSVAIYELIHGKKQKKEIIQNTINLGFQEILNTNQNSKRIQKYRQIFQELLDKYFI